jgi:hypothetical protein
LTFFGGFGLAIAVQFLLLGFHVITLPRRKQEKVLCSWCGSKIQKEDLKFDNFEYPYHQTCFEHKQEEVALMERLAYLLENDKQ